MLTLLKSISSFYAIWNEKPHKVVRALFKACSLLIKKGKDKLSNCLFNNSISILRYKVAIKYVKLLCFVVWSVVSVESWINFLQSKIFLYS